MGFTKPTDILKKDHRLIKDIIKILETCAGELGECGKCDLKILRGCMGLISNFTHKYHRRTEETVLFKVAEKKITPWGAGSISALLYEHEEGAGQVRKMADFLQESVASGISDKETRKTVMKNIYGYSSLMSSHLLQEEKVLYPVIESLLTGQERKNILKSFEELDFEMKEIGDKARYEGLIKKYKKRLEL